MNQHVHPASHQNSALRVDFFYIPMPNKVPYLKSALTYAGQIELLKSRGLLIEDEIKAEHLLKNISYYRLSGYWYPMLADPKSAHRFKSGATFNNAFKLYCFDREFRQLVLSELEKIEVAIRAQMIYTLSHNHGAFWFNEFPLFTDPNKLKSSKGKMLIEYYRSDEEFVKAFKRKYSELLPPSWMILEISSFGILSNLYSNLKPGRNKREIASYFGLDDRTFESWLHTFTYIRNVCAHHARLWNKIFSISPKIPRSPRHQFLNTTSFIHPANGDQGSSFSQAIEKTSIKAARVLKEKLRISLICWVTSMLFRLVILLNIFKSLKNKLPLKSLLVQAFRTFYMVTI